MSILKRFEQAIAAGQKAIRTAGRDGTPPPRVAMMAMRDAIGDLPRPLPRDVSVLITDARDVETFQIPGVATEYILPPDRFPPRFSRAECDAYVVRRLAILRVKWRLGTVYVCGEGAKVLADLWLGDPEGPRPSFFRQATPHERR